MFVNTGKGQIFSTNFNVLRPFSTCKLILTKRSVFYCFVNTEAELIYGHNGIHYFRYDTVEVEKRPLDKNPFLEDQRNFIIQDPHC